MKKAKIAFQRMHGVDRHGEFRFFFRRTLLSKMDHLSGDEEGRKLQLIREYLARTNPSIYDNKQLIDE